MFFSNDTRVATNAVPNNFTVGTTDPNVGQYGWTKEDRGHYNQLVQYVEECREAVEAVTAMATYIDELARKMAGITTVYEDILRIQTSLQELEAAFQTDFTDFKTKYNDFISKYNLFKVSYEDFLVKYKEVLDAASTAKASADAAKVSETNSKASEIAAAKSAQEAAEVASKSLIYRGTWNFSQNKNYPDPKGVNSMWDIVLDNADEESGVTVNGKLWFAGDRLIYVADTTSWEQIVSGTTVKSVNGKTGAVTLTAKDVDAYTKAEVDTQLSSKVPVTRKVQGKELTGDLTFVSGDFNAVSRSGDTMSGPLNISISGNGASLSTSASGAEFTNAKTGSSLIIGNNDVLVYKGNKVYHEGFKPTAADVGAVPTTRKVNNKVLSSDINLTATDVGAAPAGYGLGEAIPEALVGDKNLNTFRYNGFRTYNVDGGDSGGPTNYGTAMDFGHIGNAGSFVGWAGQLFLSNNGSLWSRINRAPGSFEGSAWERIYTTASPPTPAEIRAIGYGENILNNAGPGPGFITSQDTGPAWVASYYGTKAGNKVVAGTLNGGAVIGAHAPGLDAWRDLFINCSVDLSPNVSTVINDPIARIQGNLTNYKIYHEGFRPTARDIDISNPLTKDIETLADVINSLREELASLKAEVQVLKRGTLES